MKNFINRVKYHLLSWLLVDICRKCEDCTGCRMAGEIEFYDYRIACFEDDVRIQAREVWGLNE